MIVWLDTLKLPFAASVKPGSRVTPVASTTLPAPPSGIDSKEGASK